LYDSACLFGKDPQSSSTSLAKNPCFLEKVTNQTSFIHTQWNVNIWSYSYASKLYFWAVGLFGLLSGYIMIAGHIDRLLRWIKNGSC